MLGEAWALGQGLGVEDFVEFEGEVAAAEELLGHGGIPGSGCSESRRGGGAGDRLIGLGDMGAEVAIAQAVFGLRRAVWA
ncbi:hypothetical protein PRtIB026_A11140 [Pseudomonas sp. RtIB026]|nr:hypothetical protein PRtIB026_A11140 [Pseudomonas sp. RtIB026]